MFSLVLASSLIAGSAFATITFDDLAGNITPIPAGYQGFNWVNLYDLNGDSYSGNPSGYGNGVVSHHIVAFNAGGTPASITKFGGGTFDFGSAYLTGAWNDGLSISVTGFLLGNPIYTQTVTVNTSGPQNFVFNFLGIDAVGLVSSGGVNHGYNGQGPHFVMDSVEMSAVTRQGVPDAGATGLLFGLACAGLGLVRRKI